MRRLHHQRRSHHVPVKQGALRTRFDVAGQEHTVRPHRDFQHERPVVQVETGWVGCTTRTWPQQAQLRAAALERSRTTQAWGKTAPRNVRLAQRFQQRHVFCAARRLAVPPEFTDVQLLGHGQEPVLVIRMAVRQHHAVEPGDAAALEPRQHGQFTHAAAVAHFTACINERARAIVAFKQRRVAVSDVQPGQAHRLGPYAILFVVPDGAQKHQRHRDCRPPTRVPVVVPAPREGGQHHERKRQAGRTWPVPDRQPAHWQRGQML